MKKETNHLKILILSQDKPFLQLLKMLLNGVGIRETNVNSHLKEALGSYKSSKPDVCIIDISLAESKEDGTMFVDQIQRMRCKTPIIFLIPSYDSALYEKLKTFKYSIILTKELSTIKLHRALDYARLQIENNYLYNQIQEQLSPSTKLPEVTLNDQSNSSSLFFRIGDSFRRIDKEKIDFFFAENKMTYARVEGRNYPTNVVLKSLERQLFPSFLRCHKKYIVNVANIETILLKEEKVKIGDQLLSIGYGYRKNFLKNLNLLK